MLALIGIAVAFFAPKIFKSTAKPSYQKFSLQLLSEDGNNLPDDVVDADPIRIHFDEGENIISYKILKKTKVVNEFRLKMIDGNPHELLVDFLYLYPKDGVVIELLHDSVHRYPMINGTIKGMP